MPRIKADPVDIAFRAWTQLDDAQKQRLADRVAGYQEARGVVAMPAPRARQRKVKPTVGGGAYTPQAADLYSLNPLNPSKGGSGVPLKTA